MFVRHVFYDIYIYGSETYWTSTFDNVYTKNCIYDPCKNVLQVCIFIIMAVCRKENSTQIWKPKGSKEFALSYIDPVHIEKVNAKRNQHRFTLAK